MRCAAWNSVQALATALAGLDHLIWQLLILFALLELLVFFLELGEVAELVILS